MTVKTSRKAMIKRRYARVLYTANRWHMDEALKARTRPASEWHLARSTVFFEAAMSCLDAIYGSTRV